MAYLSNFTGAQIDAALGALISGINSIGSPGAAGFGCGTAPPSAVFAGMQPLYGYTDPTHPNYGNYQFFDGSVMVWIPKFYYRIGHASNPTYGVHGVNSVDVAGVKTFATRFDAEAQGYALHRAYIDGGVEQDGFFVDKYQASKNALGTGFVASSIAGGNPISTAADHNPIGELTATAGINAYYAAITAAKARDGVNGTVNPNSRFFCVSRFQWAALALLSLAHGQAATSSTWCAWYDAGGVTNYPKGNNAALRDINDASVVYVSDGYSSCAKTGSGVPFAKTTHNGQACGVADLNGNMLEVNIGLTCRAVSKGITAVARSNPCYVTSIGHGFTTGQQVALEDVGGMTQVNGRAYTLTVVDVNSFSLDGIDATGYATYTSGGIATAGTFSLAKTTTRMRDFTAGSTLSTDHWGATGVAAMMEVVSLPGDGSVFWSNLGSGANQVFSPAISGGGWHLTGMGVPQPGCRSAFGTNLFGADSLALFVVPDTIPLAAGASSWGSACGVWQVYLGHNRTTTYALVGFRAACYP